MMLSTWRAVVSEFPVEVQGVGTKIDFILERIGRRAGLDVPVYLLGECKRANQALSNWCFAKAPYVHHAWPSTSEPLLVERFNTSATASAVEIYSNAPESYHIGVEVRSPSKGDQQGESGQAIEDAASQVLRGLNGFVETLNRNIQLLRGQSCAYAVPVIFTTANLFGSEVNLWDTDLETGMSDANKKHFRPLSWLCYQYHTSPGTKHSLSPFTRPADLGPLMQSEYIRTIPIVNPAGIEAFLVWLSGLYIE